MLFLFCQVMTQARKEYIVVLITDIGTLLQPLMDISCSNHCELLVTFPIYQIVCIV